MNTSALLKIRKISYTKVTRLKILWRNRNYAHTVMLDMLWLLVLLYLNTIFFQLSQQSYFGIHELHLFSISYEDKFVWSIVY